MQWDRCIDKVITMDMQPDSDSYAGGVEGDADHAPRPPVRAPRPPLWVIVCGVAFLVLLAVFVVIVATHSAGGGGHGLGFTGI